MACLHPLRAFPTGAVSDKGKPVYFVTSHNFPYATFEDFDKRGLPWRIPYVENFIEIPCGSCIGCRKDKQRSWAFRIMAESLVHNYNYFLTLTYDDAHLPDGLRKEDLQLFNKRLRKSFGFRFFACGEYGDSFKRPHYHGIYFFDSPIDDLRLWSRHGSYTLFNSLTLSRIWGKGFVVVGSLSPSAAAYCAKYCLKGSSDPVGCASSFIVMSRRPGLGDYYFEHNLSKGRLVLPSGSGSCLFGGLPRYVKAKHDIKSDDSALIKLVEVNKMVNAGYDDLDDFRFFEDYLEKHPFLKH